MHRVPCSIVAFIKKAESLAFLSSGTCEVDSGYSLKQRLLRGGLRVSVVEITEPEQVYGCLSSNKATKSSIQAALSRRQRPRTVFFFEVTKAHKSKDVFDSVVWFRQRTARRRQTAVSRSAAVSGPSSASCPLLLVFARENDAPKVFWSLKSSPKLRAPFFRLRDSVQTVCDETQNGFRGSDFSWTALEEDRTRITSVTYPIVGTVRQEPSPAPEKLQLRFRNSGVENKEVDTDGQDQKNKPLHLELSHRKDPAKQSLQAVFLFNYRSLLGPRQWAFSGYEAACFLAKCYPKAFRMNSTIVPIADFKENLSWIDLFQKNMVSGGAIDGDGVSSAVFGSVQVYRKEGGSFDFEVYQHNQRTEFSLKGESIRNQRDIRTVRDFFPSIMKEMDVIERVRTEVDVSNAHRVPFEPGPLYDDVPGRMQDYLEAVSENLGLLNVADFPETGETQKYLKSKLKGCGNRKFLCCQDVMVRDAQKKAADISTTEETKPNE